MFQSSFLPIRKKARGLRKYLYHIPDIHDGAGPAGLTMILQGHTRPGVGADAKAHISV